MKLQNKTVLITGGSRGLGYALALEYLKERAHVLLVARDQKELQRAVTELAEKHPAGAILVGPFDSMDDVDFRAQMELHFFANLRLTQKVLPLFRKQGEGQFVNICSMGGKVAVPHMLPYDASKFALAGFSQVLHAELRHLRLFSLTHHTGRKGRPKNR